MDDSGMTAEDVFAIFLVGLYFAFVFLLLPLDPHLRFLTCRRKQSRMLRDYALRFLVRKGISALF